MIYDLHIHSKYSYDSILEPKTILKIAKKRKLDGIAITDHNTIKGGMTALQENCNPCLDVIVGAEIKTDIGDVIGLYLEEEIHSRIFYDVVEEIHNQNGVAVLAHPFRNRSNYSQDELNDVDLIEGFNARSPRRANLEAQRMALSAGKMMTAGSDAHNFFEIGRGRTILTRNEDCDLVGRLLSFEGEESHFYLSHISSLVIQKLKTFSV